jgi:hypothetical protein
MDNVPGTLARMCNALGEKKVNIIALMSTEHEGRSVVRVIVDKVPVAKRVLQANGCQYTEERVLVTKLRNRPGELAAAATKFADANINIDYAYSGVEPRSAKPLVVLSVADVARGTKLVK